MPKSSKLNSKRTKILFLATEIKPFLNLSSAASFVHKLVERVDHTQAYEIRVIMPKFGLINERTNSLHEVQRLSGINVTVGHEEVSLVVKVASLKPSKVQVYFLDNEYLFERKGFFHDKEGNFYPDNQDRITFINKSVLSVLTYLRWNPQIVHAIGWPWALLPKYAKTSSKSSVALKKAKYIYTHNDYSFEKKLTPELLQETKELPTTEPLSLDTLYNLAKEYADVTEENISEEYTKEGEEKEDQSIIEHYENLYKRLIAPKEEVSTSAQALQSPEVASPS